MNADNTDGKKSKSEKEEPRREEDSEQASGSNIRRASDLNPIRGQILPGQHLLGSQSERVFSSRRPFYELEYYFLRESIPVSRRYSMIRLEGPSGDDNEDNEDIDLNFPPDVDVDPTLDEIDSDVSLASNFSLSSISASTAVGKEVKQITEKQVLTDPGSECSADGHTSQKQKSPEPKLDED